MKPKDINIGDYNSIVKLYHNESDRAAAILAGSFLEHYIGVFLKAFLIDDGRMDELFDRFGPLASFHQRIRMAAAMGLVNEGIRDELHAIKNIRNYFAHHPMEASFADCTLDKHFDRLNVSHDPGFNSSGEGPLTDRKLIYLFSIGCIACQLHIAIAQKRGASPRALCDTVPLESPDNVIVDLSTYDTLANNEADPKNGNEDE